MDNEATPAAWMQRLKVPGYVLPLAALAIVALAVFLLIHKVMAVGNWPNGTDLHVYRAAADAILAGGTPYDPGLFTYDPYGYPPLFAEFIALLRLVLGWGPAWLIWPLACALCLFVALTQVMRRFGVRTPLSWVVLVTGLLLLGHLGRSDLFHGQPDFVLLLFFVLGLMNFRRGAVLLAALAWGAMIVVKPFLGAIVFFLLRRGQWRAAIATVGASGALFFLGFLPFITRLPAAITGWLGASRWFTSIPNVAKPANQTAYGLFTRMFVETPHSAPWLNMPVLVPVLMIPVLVVVVAGIFFGVTSRTQMAAQNWSAPEAGAHDLVEATLPLGLFMAMGPLTETPHLYLLLPAMFGSALMLSLHWRQPAQRRLWGAATAFWALLFLIFIVPVGLKLLSPYHWAELSGLEILASGLNAYIVAAASMVSAWALYVGRKPAPGTVR